MEQKKLHDNEEKCKEQAYAILFILRIVDTKYYAKNGGKKIFHNTDQNPKSEKGGRVTWCHLYKEVLTLEK